MSERQPHLLFVVGPTACGKSDFAVAAAEALAAPLPEIINCDSVQFFEGVDIGAAKPEPELLLRVPHHLVGHRRLGDVYTAGDFRRDALRVLDGGAQRGVDRFVPVGGSGFYVQALEKGMYDVPEIAPDVRARVESDVETLGWPALHAELQSRDPEAAKKIPLGDRYRILRTLEILRSDPEGGTLIEIRARFEAKREPAPFRVSKVGLFRPRDVLRARVTERTRSMLAKGLIEEVEGLRKKGFGDWAPMKSVGYKEVQAYLDGALPREELEASIVTSTMQLAKRQMTWFKRDSEIRWFDVERGFAAPLEYVLTQFEP